MDIFANHEERSWPRISANFDFKAPLRFQDEFEVRTEIGAVTRSTIQWAHVLMRGDTVIGTGTVTTVYVAEESRRQHEVGGDPGGNHFTIASGSAGSAS